MKLSDKAQESLAKVVKQFEVGDLSPIKQIVQIQRDPNDTMPACKWSFTNQIMAFIQAGGELDCRGFNQWKEVGRSVKKGGKAVYILAPTTIKKEEGGEERRIIVGFHTVAVFPCHQTEGDELAKFDYRPLEMPPLLDVAKRLGVSVDYGPIESGARGWYSPTNKHIRLGVHHPKTFYHELAHACHDAIEGVKGGQEEGQEVIAEFTACVLSDLYGESLTGNCWEYIQHYSSDPLTAIYKAMSMVEKVLNLIFDEEKGELEL